MTVLALHLTLCHLMPHDPMLRSVVFEPLADQGREPHHVDTDVEVARVMTALEVVRQVRLESPSRLFKRR